MANLGKYNKAIIAVVGVVVAGLVSLYGNNPDVRLLVEVLTALGVYQVPNQV